MPKQYDPSRNYYADLELPPTATCDDARKQYRKLVLKYHPDRNIGKEDEVVPKFQAVQAAHEILSDPDQKAKYDQDRSRTGQQSRGPVPRSQTYGNPYQASTAYPPPPRRTQPGTWQRPPPQAFPASAGAGGGADRFSNFPRSAPTAKQRPDSAQERTNMFRAWQNMNTGQQQSPRPANATSNTGATPKKPRPPPRQGRMPNEEEIRAGMNYKAPPPNFDRAEEKQSAWSAFQQANAGKAGVNRSKSNKTPKKAGFDPNAPGSDERAAPGSNNYARHRSEDYGKGSPFQPSPNPNAGPPPTPSPAPSTAGRPHADPLHPYTSRDAPFQEGNRQRTPYHSYMAEKEDLSGEGMRRSFSHRDNANISRDEEDAYERPRSTSPRSQQRHSAGQRDFHPGTARAPFVVYSSSEDSDLEPERSSSSEFSSAGASKEASEVPTPDPIFTRPSPLFNNTNDRPKKQPSPPSKRVNGPFTVPDPPPSVFADNSRPQTGSEEKPMQQKSNSNMYVDIVTTSQNPSSSKTSPFSPGEWATRMFGTFQNSTFEESVQLRRPSVPKWAIPSSITPEREKRRIDLAGGANVPSDHKSDAPTIQAKKLAEQYPEPPFASIPSTDQMKTTLGDAWNEATDEEKNAYITTRQNMQMVYGSVGGNFDMDVFLRLASTVRLGNSSGNTGLDCLLNRSLASYPSVGFRYVLGLDADKNYHSFSFPIKKDTFKSTNGKSRSEESINTKFSNGEWNGKFTGQGQESSPPTSAGSAMKPPSPSLNRTRQGFRAATSPFTGPPPPVGSAAPSNGAGSMPPPPPPRPANTEGSPLEGVHSAPQGPPPGQPGFDQQAWAKQFKETSWAWPPPPPPPNGPSQPGSRASSRQGARSAPRRGFSADEAQPRQRSFTAYDGSQVVVEEDPRNTPSPEEMGDAMDIDDAPPIPAPSQHNDGFLHPSSATEEKAPRMVPVPPSPWRQQQQQPNEQPNGNNSHQPTTSTPRVQPQHSPSLNTVSLEDLSNVEPLAKSAAEGLRNFQDMSATLPFQSQASTHNAVDPHTLQMPPVPRPPAAPHKLSKMSWHEFARAFGKYLRAFHTFNATMLMFFETRQVHAERQLEGGLEWLEAWGDTSGASSGSSTAVAGPANSGKDITGGAGGGGVGFAKYMKDVREDEKVRETWKIGCERHAEAVVEFDRVRERVRRSVIGGILPEV